MYSSGSPGGFSTEKRPDAVVPFLEGNSGEGLSAGSLTEDVEVDLARGGRPEVKARARALPAQAQAALLRIGVERVEDVGDLEAGRSM